MAALKEKKETKVMNHDLNNEVRAGKMSSPTTVQDSAMDLNVDSKDDSQDEVKKGKKRAKREAKGRVKA